MLDCRIFIASRFLNHFLNTILTRKEVIAPTSDMTIVLLSSFYSGFAKSWSMYHKRLLPYYWILHGSVLHGNESHLTDCRHNTSTYQNVTVDSGQSDPTIGNLKMGFKGGKVNWHSGIIWPPNSLQNGWLIYPVICFKKGVWQLNQ